MSFVDFDDFDLFERKVDLPSKTKFFFTAGNPLVEVHCGYIVLMESLNRELDLERSSRVVFVYNVPSYMAVSEFIMLVSGYDGHLNHIRVLSLDDMHDSYCVLLKFSKIEYAVEFSQDFNKKEISSLSSDVFHVGFVKKVKYIRPEKAILFPPPKQLDLPSCSICLEKLNHHDKTLLTILCNHSYHASCLSCWKDENRCPICRYSQTPVDPKSACHECGTQDGLWLCLICGHVGCSNYDQRHADMHFENSSHTYALDLDSQKVWDFTGKTYVHRIAVNEEDGKLIQLPDPNTENFNRVSAEKEDISKLEAIILEYEYLIQTQLFTQKKYYEEQMEEIEKEHDLKLSALEIELTNLIDLKISSTAAIIEIEKERTHLENQIRGNIFIF
eukprot:TRINITY_DN5529_c0_g1_i1.p1 TRINITY_DN5529_c0_g1~~TRINITY_DN5529_c0_g1_i1.p1  ORF type:complete len:387 (-),score=70.44 TRINITY_DN5529_c0_g1_i1:420-1580(-)